MALIEHFDTVDDLHPIDLAEHIAEHHRWDFDRVHDDQIALVVEGQWRTYSVTLAWSANDQTLRLICTFEMEPPEDRLPALYECLNRTNDMCWAGAFTYWAEQRLMVYRYGLVLAGEQVAGPDQIDTMISAAILSAERFYPAFQLVTWAERTPVEALNVAISEAYGRA
ncbi:YbjN domain-containing protein [Thalassorhabdomicrobium marinisediminis]|uniref:Diacylglyceryl transferase n=1 Tax=Thalassorhabdomicrobium marinisediminis TaxID=2170577 RepID=A0A2T7FX42_9RHOB|nr:YbjN domain-containing protein [Thalassorhabdomicrobium marinisediminis]PVA06737.1 diacylglyceryl transferase [Thalassorhabdomicrobium marinisediminis]